MTPPDELADRIDYNRLLEPEIEKRMTRKRDSVSLPFLSVDGPINARGPDLSHARARIIRGPRTESGEGIDRSIRHGQFNTWPKWFVGA